MGKLNSSYSIHLVKSSLSACALRMKLLILWLVVLILCIDSPSAQLPDNYFQIQTYPFKNGFARLQVGDRIGFISAIGRRVVDVKYEAAKDFSTVVDGKKRKLASVQLDQKWSFIDQQGYRAIDWQFDSAETFQHKLAVVGIGDIKSRRYGYIDTNGQVILPPQYTKSGSFVAAKIKVGTDEPSTLLLAPFQSGRKFGYLSYDQEKQNVEVAVQPRYSQAFPFSTDGIAKVAIGKRYGYISATRIALMIHQNSNLIQRTDPLMIVPANYQQAYDTVDYLAIVQDRRKWLFLQITPDEVANFKPLPIKPMKSLVSVPIPSKTMTFDAVGQMSSRLIRFGKYVSATDNQMIYGFLSYQSDVPQIIVEIPGPYNYCGDFMNGLARVLIGGRLVDGKPVGGGLFGYIDQKGKIVINPQFILAENFSDGLAYVEKTDNLGQTQRGYINTKGDFQFEVDLGLAYDFFDDLAVFSIAKSLSNTKNVPTISQIKFGYVDQSGKVVIPARFQKAGNFQHQMACVLDENGKYGYIGRDGGYKIPPQFEQASDFFQLKNMGQLGDNGFYFQSSNMGTFLALEDQYENCFDNLDLNRDGQIGLQELNRSISVLQLKEANGLLNTIEAIVLSFKDDKDNLTDFFNLCNQNQDQHISRFEYMSQTQMEMILEMDNRPRIANQIGQQLMMNFPPLASVENDGQQFYINQSGQRIDQLSQSATITNNPVDGQKK